MFSFWSKLRLFRRCTIWCPTWLGLFSITILILLPATWWFLCGETFLSVTQRKPPQILVVEGWIGFEAIHGAKVEFEQQGYQYVVTTGGLTAAEGWQKGGWSYAEGAEHELIRLGVPKERIIVAPAQDTESQRTYESALAVWRALQSKGIQPRTLNVFTVGAHARRSLLVFSKACQPTTQVGVISWAPPGYEVAPWWRSSERARELIAETAGYMYELLLNSGRGSNSVTKL